MIECYSCGTVFEVDFDDDYEDAEVKFCPCCGEDLDIEIDFQES